MEGESKISIFSFNLSEKKFVLKKIIIAIDGPAASGKSTTAKLVAAQLGYLHIDTGAMYRAMALKVLRNKISEHDSIKVAELAKVTSVRYDEQQRTAQVFLRQDQISLAIGRGGTNIKLAGMLTGFELDVFRENEEIFEEEDVDLDEFRDEIQDWIIDEFKKIGCDTARDVLRLSVDELERRTDLDRETIEEVMSVFSNEIENEYESEQE